MTSLPASFVCSSGGAIARGKRLMGLLFGTVGLLMVGAAIYSWSRGSWGAALLAAALTVVTLWTWRTTGSLEPRWIEIDERAVTITTRSVLVRLPRAGAMARVLNEEERRHLERLATMGVTAPSGGFDSRLLGEFELYASNLETPVLVEAGDLRVVLTPDDPEAFIAALTGTIPAS